MYIVGRRHKGSQLRRSGMLLRRSVAYNISLLRSFCLWATLRIYKHLAPPELLLWVTALAALHLRGEYSRTSQTAEDAEHAKVAQRIQIDRRLCSSQIFAQALKQFYQIIDVTTLGQEAIDVHAQRAAPVKHRRCDPGFAATLNLLLQLLL